jgi:hypothetical protein
MTTGPPDLRAIYSHPDYMPPLMRYPDALVRSLHISDALRRPARFLAAVILSLCFCIWYLIVVRFDSILSLFAALLLILAFSMMIDVPHYVWERIRVASDDIDALFSRTSNPRSDQFRARILRLLRLSRLLTVSAATCLIMGFAYVYVHRGDSVSELFSGGLFFAFGGFMTGHSAYLIGITAAACYTISRATGLRLVRPVPIETPGLVGASRAMRLMAQVGLVLLLVCSGALVARCLTARTTSALVVSVICVSVGFAAVTAIGLLSQIWLAAPANRERDDILHRLDPQLETRYDAADTSDYAGDDAMTLAITVRLQRDISSAPTSYNDHAILSAYTAAAFGIILQLVLAGILGG